MKIYILGGFFLLTISIGHAEQYYRCGGEGGSVVFSEKPCGPNAVIKSTRDSYIGGSQPDASRNPMQQLQNYRNEVKKVERITGSSSNNRKNRKKRPGDCENVSALTLRNARISRDIMKCHSMDDVRQIYGQPRTVDSWSNRSAYDTRWRYRDEGKGRVDVYFKRGRVTQWSTHFKNN